MRAFGRKKCKQKNGSWSTGNSSYDTYFGRKFCNGTTVGVCYILKCTKKGRKKLFFRKVLCAIAIATFAAVLTVGTEMYEVGKDYSFQGLSAPVQNISLLEKIPFSFTIGQFLGIWFFMRLLIYIMIAMMSLMVSAFIERIEKAQMISLSLLVLTPISGVSEFMILGTIQVKKKQ